MDSADKSKLRPEYEVYKEQCAENYLESFTDMVNNDFLNGLTVD